MSTTNEEVLRQVLTGNDGKDLMRHLLNSFNQVLIFYMFRDWCGKQPDPKIAAGKVIMQWRAEVVKQKQTEMEALKQWRDSSPVGRVLGVALLPKDELVDAKFKEALDQTMKFLEEMLMSDVEL
jgi:hypothetical protein